MGDVAEGVRVRVRVEVEGLDGSGRGRGVVVRKCEESVGFERHSE